VAQRFSAAFIFPVSVIPSERDPSAAR